MTQRVQLSRRPLWAAVALSAVAVIAPAISPHALWSASLYDAGIAACAVACVFGARRLPPQDRLPWLLVAAGCACFFLGDVLWDVYEHAFHVEAPLPSAADIAYLAAYPCFGLGVLTLMRRRSSVDWISAMLDAGSVGLAVGLLTFEPLLLGAAGGAFPALVAGAYPVFDTVLLCLTVLLAWGGRARAANRLVLAGFVTLVVADLTYLVLERNGTYATGSWPDPLFVLGPLLFAAAAWFDFHVAAAPPRAAPRVLPPVVVAVAALVALPIDFGLAADGGHRPHEIAVRVALRLVLLGCVGARLVYQAVLHQRLLRDAHAASDRIASVLAHTADAVVFTSPNGIVREWNAGAERLFGLRREDAVGTNALRRFTEANHDAILQAIEAAGADGTEMTVPIEIDGRILPIALNVEAVIDDSGVLAGFVTVARDDTRSVVARQVHANFSRLDPDEALRRFATDLHAYVPFDILSLSTVDGDDFRELARVRRDEHREFKVVERDGLFHGSLQAIGYSPTDAAYVLVTPERLDRYGPDVRALGPHGIIALQLRRADGTLRGFLSLSFDRAHQATRDYAEALARVATDMAESVENMVLFEESQVFADELLELNEMRDSFLALLAHEVRGPMSAIGSAAAVLRDRRHAMTRDQTHNMLEGIASSAKHVARITGDLIDAGRTGEGRFACTMADIDDLGTIVQRAATSACGGDRVVEVSVDDGVAVRGDRDRLTQIVSNLVANACKFADGAVEVTLQSGREGATIAVVDHGPGIAAEHADRVFDRYTRLHLDGMPRRPGTGLGLYIARELARAHGGDIFHQPTPGGGATFVVTLPTCDAMLT